MSAPGPESIPTSADPRSKRPVKKRALTPTSSQAASVDALFAKPEQDIRIPPPTSSSAAAARVRRAVPPDIVTNVQGSSAGAGSGEFHVYKASRRREYERLRLMDEELREEQARQRFESEKKERAARDDEKTRKNREKRDKKKKAKEKIKAQIKVAAHAGPAESAGGKDHSRKTREEYDTETNTSGNEKRSEKLMNGGIKARVNINGMENNAKSNASAETIDGDTTIRSIMEPQGLVIKDDD